MTDGRVAPELDGERLAAWTLSLAWAEHQSFVVVGRWSGAATLDGVTAALAPVSAHHGRRADQLRALWPQRRGGLDGAAAATAPPEVDSDPLNGLINAVIEADGSFGPSGDPGWSTHTSLAALGMVTQVILPRLMVGYKKILKLSSAPSDTSIRRVGELALADATADFLAVTAKLAALDGFPSVSALVGMYHRPSG